MRTSGLLETRQFRLAVLLAAILLVAITAASISVARLYPANPIVSDIGAVLCAAVAAALFVWAWRGMSGQETSRRTWGLIALGVVLWTAAEATWAFYELVLKIELPYPSVADAFWLLGYVPVYAALILRSRSFQSSSSVTQRRVVPVFILLYSALLAIYVARPLIESFDASKLLESLVNVAYPLADWGLCILTLVIVFSLETGRFAVVWRLFGLGVLLMTTADLVYFYASWNDLYYPAGQLNLLSGLLDFLFNFSYLAMGLAVYAYTILTRSVTGGDLQIVLRSAAKMTVLLFVDARGRILSVSDNFMNLVHAPETKPYIGMELASALGIEGGKVNELLAKITSKASLKNFPILVKDTKGLTKNAYLTSLIILNEQGVTDAVALVLRADPPPAGQQEYPLKQDQQMLIEHYVVKSGAGQLQEDEAIRSYFLDQINLLYSLIQQYSGTKMADRLLEHLSEAAGLNNWQFTRTGKDIQLPQELEGHALSDLLRPLLNEAQDFAINMTDHRMVEQEMKSLEKSLGREILSTLDKYDLRVSGDTSRRPPLPATATP